MYKYPYGDSQQLNLDWIIVKLKELEASGGSRGGADLVEVSNALISLTYNTSTAYRRYDYAFLNGKLYRCLTDTSGVFNPTAWQEALIGDDLAVLTRWINAIDAAAVVDVKFDTTGTNGKIQQKYHDQYHDVVEVDYTPVQNSKRPLSSNAGYELNGAINAEQSARSSAVTTLQNGLTSEQIARANADSALQSQIDELVAPTGAAPSAAEVIDARVSFTGKTYTSLGDSVRGQASEVNRRVNALTELQLLSPLLNITGAFDERYINSSGAFGSDSANRGRYYKCKPNTTYVAKRTNTGTMWGICYVHSGSDLVGGGQTADFAKNTSDTLSITTDDIAQYLYVYNAATGSSDFVSKTSFYEYCPIAEENKYTVDVDMEVGGLSSGTYANNNTLERRRTKYLIKTQNAQFVEFLDINDYTHTYIIIYCYDSNYEYLGYVEKQNATYFELQANTAYIRFVVYTTADIRNLRIKLFNATDKPKMLKIPRTATSPETITFMTTETDFTTSRLILPSTYDPVGNKTPLILWMDGSGNFTQWTSAMSESKMTYLQYLADEGFAVFSVFAWGWNFIGLYQNCGRAYPYPTPTCLNSIRKGLEFVCDRFNIDADNVHIMCKSQGGQCATYFASRPLWNFKSIGMFSPVVDHLSMNGDDYYTDTRKAIAYDMNLSGNVEYYINTNYSPYSSDGHTFWNTNKSKLCQLNEAWTNLVGGTVDTNLSASLEDGEKYWQNKSRTDIYTNTSAIKTANIPVKIWGAADDDETPYRAMTQLIAQLQNGVTEAELRTMPNNTGKHSAADLGTNTMNVTAANGTAYNNLPVGWYENVQWIKNHMPK